MAVPGKRGLLAMAICAGAICAVAIPTRADEIRLKDGKKLYGVIVAYEDNMFKIRTDFGYVLVEKDKIASIVPSAPAAPKKEPQPAAKKEATPPAKRLPGDGQPAPEPAVASSNESSLTPANASAKTVGPTSTEKRDKAAPKVTNAMVKPEIPANTRPPEALAPAIKPAATATAAALATPAAPPAPPKEPELPANREEIQGNLYTNYTHGFRMYKAPSWNLIEDARSALPDAIVALGTFNESTLMIVGQEKTKEPLEAAAANVEKRLREVYENYRRISQRKTALGGLPAVEYHYRGKAEDHDWSGTLAVVARGNDVFTLLGMTYADSDLIQIQENVIARSIASLDFNVH